MSMEISVTNNVGTATFNRPDAMNSITAKILTEWQDGIRELADNPDVRAIVVTGAGRSFSAGLDLKQPFDGGDDMPWSQDRNQATRLAKALRYGTDFIRTLASCPAHDCSGQWLCDRGGNIICRSLRYSTCCTPSSLLGTVYQIGHFGGDLGLSWFLPRIIECREQPSSFLTPENMMPRQL